MPFCIFHFKITFPSLFCFSPFEPVLDAAEIEPVAEDEAHDQEGYALTDEHAEAGEAVVKDARQMPAPDVRRQDLQQPEQQLAQPQEKHYRDEQREPLVLAGAVWPLEPVLQPLPV